MWLLRSPEKPVPDLWGHVGACGGEALLGLGFCFLLPEEGDLPT